MLKLLREKEKPKYGTKEAQKSKPSLLYHFSGAHELIRLQTHAAVPSLAMPLSNGMANDRTGRCP